MISHVENISGTKKRITIEVTAGDLEYEMQKSLLEVKQKTNLPGYRAGKAPMSLIEKRFRRNVEQDVLERLIPEYYQQALKSESLTPITHPVIESRDYESKGNLKIVFSVEIRPHVEGLVYEGLPVKHVQVDVDENEVDTYLRRLVESKATYTPGNGPIGKDDLIVADMEIPDSNQTMTDQYIKIGSELYPESFHNDLIGKNSGDVFDTTVVFDDNKQYPEDFREKTVQFKITIKEIKSLQMPPIDDDFAKDIGFESLEDARKDIREAIIKSKRERVVMEQKAELIKEMIGKYDFEVPETPLKTEIDSIVYQMKQTPNYKDASEEEIIEKFKPEAIMNVKAMVLLDIIGEKENVKITEQDLSRRITALAYSTSMTPQALVQFYQSDERALESLRYTVFREKVMDVIYSKCTIVPEAAQSQ